MNDKAQTLEGLNKGNHSSSFVNVNKKGNNIVMDQHDMSVGHIYGSSTKEKNLKPLWIRLVGLIGLIVGNVIEGFDWVYLRVFFGCFRVL